MEKDKGRERVQVGGRAVLGFHFFGVYAPLAKRFSLPIRRVRGREARCYAPKLSTVLTALTIHLIKPDGIVVVCVCFVLGRAVNSKMLFHATAIQGQLPSQPDLAKELNSETVKR